MTDTGNPFFEPWTGPFGFPPFDRIRADHFAPAFDRFMAEHKAQIDAIAGSPAPATFANTIEALERGGRMLSRVQLVFENLTSSCTNDALDAIDLEYAPKFAQHYTAIALNPALFRRIDDLHGRRDTLGLQPDQMRLLERRYLTFVRQGAKLDQAGRTRMSAISERLATLHTMFAQNVMHDEKEWLLLLEPGDLAGLPPFLVEGAAASPCRVPRSSRF
jgi:peptidyl-dipeptidase Dcp